eukprot:CAMPEP_0197826746 /NCGR_PEP_ID=MMETSP1437-20131217/3656_1 /TAXON_ID=49252 ORGANISM="Eucampia antarctica, Strain CCMP1452" /NCGR_SAMPLE_ID=MMETSP1437 /ASSEMBLY_ACC=CAM_ASM_001096 /LENGTH=268 /DNA_ID=CAMNT_0043427315 /DNA_START=260 /DNA_END=1066 /DNA_ORIENTATION=+
MPSISALASPAARKVVVFGGTGFVGSAVCERLVKKGYNVVGLSRRGTNPKPGDEYLDQVKWVVGDALNKNTVKEVVKDADAVVHAVGLLFDVESGLDNLNTFVSGSGSLPGDDSTYDNITRKTMFNVVEAVEAKSNFFSKNKKTPLCFVSCAEAGWPDVALGPQVEEYLAPDWLRKYLKAKRSVETRLNESKGIRPVIFRPSLIWDWSKFDVLPVIPVFNIASAVGVPFVDKTVRVETLADAIVAGIDDDSIKGVQRFKEMEALSKRK